eukprot:scaffold215740_cov17-Tisochrysis_lutea.AAC.1
MGLRTDEACMHLKLHVNPFSPAVAVAAAAGHGPIKGSTGKDTMLATAPACLGEGSQTQGGKLLHLLDAHWSRR